MKKKNGDFDNGNGFSNDFWNNRDGGRRTFRKVYIFPFS